MTITLLESVSEGVKARIRIASEGMGSSGYYSAEVLERDGPTAFPAGTFIVKDHQGESEAYNTGGTRKIDDLVGKLLTDAEYVEAEKALYAEALFYSKNKELIQTLWEDVDLSLEAEGKRDDSGNISELMAHPNNAVALVPNGGRDGKIVAFYESLDQPKMTETPSAIIDRDESQSKKEYTKMTPEEITSLAEALAKAVAPAFADLKESLTPKDPEPKDEPDTSVAEVVEALLEADLPKDLRQRVMVSDKPLDLIADFVTIRESVRENGTAQLGKFQGAGSTETSFVSAAWTGGSR